MKISNASATLALLGLLAFTSGCKDFFDVNVDPLQPVSARLQDLLPGAQAGMATGLGFSLAGLGQPTSSLVNQLSSARGIGSYTLDGSSVETQWRTLYTDCLANNEQIITQGTASQDWGYVGIAQIQKAYVFSQMVDVWGDIPYSEALQGVGKPAPKFDKDSDIYKDLIQLINTGIQNLAKPSGTIPTNVDVMYKGDKAKWARLGRSLKLKLFTQIRLNPTAVLSSQAALADSVQRLLATPAQNLTDDFEFQYYAQNTPENRHPGYQANYAASPEDQIGRFFYVTVMNSRNDPRLPYFFYNQATPGQSVTADFVLGRFVTTLLGSIGAAASTSNSSTRTLPGLYAVGGKFDNGAGGVAIVTSGKGAVAQRLFTYSGSLFTEAEARLMVLNDVAGARTAYEQAIRANFAKVNAIATADGSPVIAATAINTYVNSALLRFDGTTRPASLPASAGLSATEAKLYNIIEEKYTAGFGFGLDAYTDYRRTGYPFITLPGTTAEPNTRLIGGYPIRLPYRQGDLTSNPNAPAQPSLINDKIFWDK